MTEGEHDRLLAILKVHDEAGVRTRMAERINQAKIPVLLALTFAAIMCLTLAYISKQQVAIESTSVAAIMAASEVQREQKIIGFICADIKDESDWRTALFRIEKLHRPKANDQYYAGRYAAFEKRANKTEAVISACKNLVRNI